MATVGVLRRAAEYKGTGALESSSSPVDRLAVRVGEHDQ